MAKRTIIHEYKVHETINDYLCFYCGFYGQSKDHIPPISWHQECDEPRIIVRSCILCNSLLNSKPFLTLLSRCDYLLIKYQKRFQKTLNLPPWTDEEINQLSGKLKRTVILGLKKKAYIEKKLAFISNMINILQGY